MGLRQSEDLLTFFIDLFMTLKWTYLGKLLS